MPILLQIIHLHESHTSGVAHTAYNCSVIARLQRCDDRRLTWLSWSVPTVLDRADLVAGDDPANYRRLPVIIRSDQSTCTVVQVQCRISQCIGNSKVGKLGADGTQNNRF